MASKFQHLFPFLSLVWLFFPVCVQESDSLSKQLNFLHRRLVFDQNTSFSPRRLNWRRCSSLVLTTFWCFLPVFFPEFLGSWAVKWWIDWMFFVRLDTKPEQLCHNVISSILWDVWPFSVQNLFSFPVYKTFLFSLKDFILFFNICSLWFVTSKRWFVLTESPLVSDLKSSIWKASFYSGF